MVNSDPRRYVTDSEVIQLTHRDAIVSYLYKAYMDGYIATFQDFLKQCVIILAQENRRLTEYATKAMSESPPPHIIVTTEANFEEVKARFTKDTGDSKV